MDSVVFHYSLIQGVINFPSSYTIVSCVSIAQLSLAKLKLNLAESALYWGVSPFVCPSVRP